jgi:hypothetical protein
LSGYLAASTSLLGQALPRSPLIAPLLWCLFSDKSALFRGWSDLGTAAEAAVSVGFLMSARQRHTSATARYILPSQSDAVDHICGTQQGLKENMHSAHVNMSW